MPTYEYRCKKCGDFEYTQSIKDQALKTCPDCGNDVQKLISNNIGIIFKGSGFYINDSQTNNGNPDRAS